MKSGAVAVIGRANAGKSTLINVLVGEKISIVSPKPQTTRDTVLGVMTREDYQIVFMDTPGIYKSATLLNSFMQKETADAAKDVDLILYVIDAHDRLSEEEVAAVSKYGKMGVPLVVALTKTDIMQPEKVPEALARLSEEAEDIDVVPVSARKGRNLKELLSTLLKFLPEGEPLFPEDVVSDKSEKFMCAEIMREKILLRYEKEIPHGVAIIVNKFEDEPTGTKYIDLDIVCEKQNHKAILIGKQGQALKETLSFAREGMEKFLGRKVFLKAYVVVKENWRDRENLMREFGYGEKR
ncbi:MAG: GTPase Era [Clostridia bacterium]|jgi:GTP-binding protein Era|nr:GTPase Era [Clostridia bacterium]